MNLLRVTSLIPSIALVFVLSGAAMAQAPAAQAPAAENKSIPLTARLEPDILARMIRSGRAPAILQVGFETLYKQGHIRNAIYAGPASTQAGRELLRKAVAHFDRSRLLVIYCGCCPWPDCPNIRPAYHMLRKMGFTNVRALYIPQNFGTDWVKLGYPTVRGS